MSSPVEHSGLAVGEHNRAGTAGREWVHGQPRLPVSQYGSLDVTANSLDSAVSGSILKLRLRESRRAEALTRLGTTVLSLWFLAALCWAAWTVLNPSGDSAAQPWLWFWIGSGTLVFGARAWLADRRDARLRGAAEAWVRSAQGSDPVTVFPEAFRDAFCRSDRVLDLAAVALLLTGGALAIADTVTVVANYLQHLQVAWRPSMTVAVTLVATGICVVAVSGHQGRRRARQLRDLRSWRH